MGPCLVPHFCPLSGEHPLTQAIWGPKAQNDPPPRDPLQVQEILTPAGLRKRRTGTEQDMGLYRHRVASLGICQSI